MSALATSGSVETLIDPPATERSAPRLFEPASGGVTLEGRVLGLWEDLVARGSAECPVCGGRIGRDGCDGCGSELS